MKAWNLCCAALGGFLLAACASHSRNYHANTANLDLPSPAVAGSASASRTGATVKTTAGPVTTLSGPSTSVTGSAVAADQAAVASGSVNLPNTPAAPVIAATPSVATTTSGSSAVAALNTTTYTVEQGDSLWKIAHKFKTTVNTIKALNGLNNNLIRPGQVLKVPAA